MSHITQSLGANPSRLLNLSNTTAVALGTRGIIHQMDSLQQAQTRVNINSSMNNINSE